MFGRSEYLLGQSVPGAGWLKNWTKPALIKCLKVAKLIFWQKLKFSKFTTAGKIAIYATRITTLLGLTTALGLTIKSYLLDDSNDDPIEQILAESNLSDDSIFKTILEELVGKDISQTEIDNMRDTILEMSDERIHELVQQAQAKAPTQDETSKGNGKDNTLMWIVGIGAVALLGYMIFKKD